MKNRKQNKKQKAKPFATTGGFLGRNGATANFTILEVFQKSINISIKDTSGKVLNHIDLSY